MNSKEEELHNPLKQLSEDAQRYAEVQSEIVRLELTNKLALGSSVIALVILIALLAFVFVIFLAIFSGLYLSELTGSYVKGFGIVTIFLFIKLLLLVAFRKRLITRPIQNAIISGVIADSPVLDTNED